MKYVFRSKTNQALINGAIVAAAFYLAFQIRFDGQLPPIHQAQLWAFPVVVAGRLLTSYLFGVYRQVWQYICLTDGFLIAVSHTAFSAVLVTFRLGLPEDWPILRFPRGVIAIEFVLSLLGCFSVRLLWRVIHERGFGTVLKQSEKGKAWRVLLIGAGTLGVTVAKELAGHEGVQAVGFVDDNAGRAGARIAGLRVLGTSSLPQITKDCAVDEVLICIRPTARNSLSDLWQLCDSLPVPTRIVPTMQEILAATADLAVLRRRTTAASAVPATQRLNNRRAHWPALSASAGQGSREVQGKTILITGGGGFIGSSLAERLVADNRLILFDRSFSNQPISFTSLLQHRNVRAVEGDIMDSRTLAELAKEAHVVVHAAAIVGVQRVCGAARETLEVNFIGTSRLLQALESNSILERMIYFSTSEVFGANSYRVDESSSPVIGSIADSRWSYATAKLAGEHLVKSYFREMGLPGVIVRPFNVFGPRRTGEHAMLRFVVNALAGVPLEVHGDGSQIRSWCYIDDFCSALVAMMERPEAVGEDFNIGNAKNTLTAYQLACKVVQAVGSSSPVVFKTVNFPDVSIRVPCSDKAHRLLGYEPSYEMDHAIRLTVDWYKQNWDFFAERTTVATV